MECRREREVRFFFYFFLFMILGDNMLSQQSDRCNGFYNLPDTSLSAVGVSAKLQLFKAFILLRMLKKSNKDVTFPSPFGSSPVFGHKWEDLGPTWLRGGILE